jgi:hypothetical protein
MMTLPEDIPRLARLPGIINDVFFAYRYDKKKFEENKS